MKNKHFKMDHCFMRKRYVSLLETGKFCDCCFIIEDEKIHSHKVILASSSPVFEAMLFGPLASSEIVVKDIVASEFRQLLTFIYTDYVEFVSVINAWSMVYIAKKYLINDLLNFCYKYIKHELGAGNVMLNYEFAVFFNDDSIRNICMSNIKMFAKVILNSDYHMKGVTLCNLLEQNDFNLKETELISLSLNWAKNECTQNNLEVTKDNIRAILKECGALSRLRFLCLPVEDIYRNGKELLYDDELEYLKFCKLKKSKENVSKLINLNFCTKSNPRNSIPLIQKMTYRRVLKAGDVFHATVESKVKTQMTVNKCVLVSGFLLPSRRQSDTTLSKEYTEHIIMTITDTATNRAIDVVSIERVMFGATQTVKIDEPYIFEAMKKYDIEISWSPSYLTWNNEYLMNYFPSMLINKDVKFEFNDPFECGFIQGICYCSF